MLWYFLVFFILIVIYSFVFVFILVYLFHLCVFDGGGGEVTCFGFVLHNLIKQRITLMNVEIPPVQLPPSLPNVPSVTPKLNAYLLTLQNQAVHPDYDGRHDNSASRNGPHPVRSPVPQPAFHLQVKKIR